MDALAAETAAASEGEAAEAATRGLEEEKEGEKLWRSRLRERERERERNSIAFSDGGGGGSGRKLVQKLRASEFVASSFLNPTTRL